MMAFERILGVSGGCRLTVPPWRFGDEAVLIAQAFKAGRRKQELPFLERLALDSQQNPLVGDNVCSPSTYGRLPDDIFDNDSFGLSSHDHVLDLGAGDGRLGAVAVLVHSAASFLGIELASSRVEDGCAALERLASALQGRLPFEPQQPAVSSMPTITSTIELRVGDALTASFGDATTHVVTYATCFPVWLSIALQQRLAADLSPSTRVLAVGAHGWQPLVEATHHSGRQQVLVNELTAGSEDQNISRVDERPCLSDVAEMVWRIEIAESEKTTSNGPRAVP